LFRFDTTTLFVRLLKDKTPTALGVLKITPANLAKQLTTFKTINATNLGEKAEAMVLFSNFFAKELWDVYSPFKMHYSNEPNAPPGVRQKRALRAQMTVLPGVDHFDSPFHLLPPPEVHYVDVGAPGAPVLLRLTRYRYVPPKGQVVPADNGPILLVHGLAMTSEMFKNDMIEKNFVEYLYERYFDVWLLDSRISIDMAASRTEFTMDVLADDFKKIIPKVYDLVGKKKLKVLAHCVGALSFNLALLSDPVDFGGKIELLINSGVALFPEVTTTSMLIKNEAYSNPFPLSFFSPSK